jgi:hypothetical protein
VLPGARVLASPSPRRPSITEQVQRFRATKSVRALAELGLSIVAQRRTIEVLYGGYCAVVHRPSSIHPAEDPAALDRIIRRKSEFAQPAVLSREQLLRTYGDRFALRDLPAGFASARRESVWLEPGRLILGEYGEGARLACVTSDGCLVSEHYSGVPGVRHIHAVRSYGRDGEFLVTTGDGHKLLDLWRATGAGIRFVRRVCRRLAGYTAIAEADGQYWVGSDFSGRPNFIGLLGGPRYFFPEPAYRMHAAAFQVRFDRYVVSINKELDLSGGRRALCVFDTRARRFVYCDYLPG